MKATPKRVHFIAIGGSAMHSLAIEAARLGWHVSGSDDEIYEPSAGRLREAGLLPEQKGWDAGHISTELDLVVLGMHAKADNPELLEAQRLGIEVVSYPTFVYRLAANMQRMVIAGSHGKTTITSMIMHVLKEAGRKFNYLVGARLEGFENPVRIDDEAALIVIEGDEYLASPIDTVPKFLQYHHHIGVISGIAWDHMNVFPTFNSYLRQFEHFADATPKAGTLIYNDEDPLVSVVCKKERIDVVAREYSAHPYEVTDEGFILLSEEHGKVPLKIFGKHNMQNLTAAKIACEAVGVEAEEFYRHIQSFKGAALRLQTLALPGGSVAYRDFAHAPSKVAATVQAARERHPGQKLTALLELHTFSSLNPEFVGQYKGSLDAADHALVFFDPAVAAKKGLGIDAMLIERSFKYPNLTVATTARQVEDFIANLKGSGTLGTALVMTSGRFADIDFAQALA